MSDMEEDEPSLDQLSQAFAEAMGRGKATTENDSAADASGESDASAADDNAERKKRRAKTKPEPDPDDACPISPQSILEAILFVGHPDNDSIPSESIAKLLRGVDVEEVAELVESLNANYDSNGIPFRIVTEPLAKDSDDAVGKPRKSELTPATSGYRLQLRDEFEHLRENFYGRVREAHLSQLAVDVLAVVAYNQPATREEIDLLLANGLDTGRVLNQLVRRDLLCSQPRKQNKDGTKTKHKEYITTDRFLSFFNLQDLGDLPRSEDPG